MTLPEDMEIAKSHQADVAILGGGSGGDVEALEQLDVKAVGRSRSKAVFNHPKKKQEER